jgi:hypothetical protein
MLPRDLECCGIRRPLDAGRAYQSAQGARRIGTAREPDEVNLVAYCIILDYEIIAFPNDLFEPEADCAAEKFLEESPSAPTPS